MDMPTRNCHFKGEVRRKMNFTCVRVCGVEGRESLSRQSSFVCEKDNPEEWSTKSLLGTTRPDDKVGSQIGRVTTPASPGPVLTGRRDRSTRVLRVGQLLHLRKRRSFQSFTEPSEIR